MCNILNVMSNNISLQFFVFAVGRSYLAHIFVYFNCTFVNPLVYFIILLFSILFYCTVLLCNLAQEFPLGLIKFYSILFYSILTIMLSTGYFCDYDWIPGHPTWRLPASSPASTPSQYYYSIDLCTLSLIIVMLCYPFLCLYNTHCTPNHPWEEGSPTLSSFSRFLPC